MKKQTIKGLSILTLVIGVVLSAVIYEIGPTTSTAYICYAEVEGEFDSIQITTDYLVGGIGKGTSTADLVSLEDGETYKEFRDVIKRMISWRVNIFCVVDGILEETNFDMNYNSTITLIIHSAGVTLTLARGIPIVSVRNLTKLVMSIAILCLTTVVAMVIGTLPEEVIDE